MWCTQRITLAISALPLIMCFNQVFAAEHDVTQEELRDLLKERDAAIIQLQHTVRVLMTRLEAVERSVNPTPLEPMIPALRLNDAGTARLKVHKGFARLEVDEKAAQRALERTLVQGGALLLPAWRMEFAPSFVYTLNEFDFPAIVTEDDALLLGSNRVERIGFTTNLDVRVGLPFDSQLELSLPYQWAEQEITTQVQGVPITSASRSGDGVGNLRVGLAKTFLRERGWLPDVVGRVTWNTGSGDSSDSDVVLGGGFESLGGSLTFIKRNDPLVFFGSASYQTVLEEDDIEPGDQFTLSFGTVLAVSPSSSLFVSMNNQFVAETEIENGNIDGSDITAITLNLGASSIVSRGFLLNLTTGIGISNNAPDYSIGLSGSVQTDALKKLLSGQ